MTSFISLSNFGTLEKYFFIYLFSINTLALILYGVDKYKAIQSQYRISEFQLLFLPVIGGGIGALMGMVIFKHKLSKPIFFIGIPLMIFAGSFIFVGICNFLR